jgi:hypothetical protein
VAKAEGCEELSEDDVMQFVAKEVGWVQKTQEGKLQPSPSWIDVMLYNYNNAQLSAYKA